MKKLLLSLGTATAMLAPITTVVACGGGAGGAVSNEWQNSKEIVIAVDGAQENFYNEVEKIFNESEHYKDGYRLKLIDKDVWGALDVITNVGYTDPAAPDLIYMPQDRLTGMLQQKALRPWTDTEATSWLTNLNATDTEKAEAQSFGSYAYQNKSTFFAAPHNKEGVAYMSNKTQEEVISDMAQHDMVSLMTEAEGFFRLQDLWYGNGLFGSLEDVVLESGDKDDFVRRLLYKDGATWKTGFDSNDDAYESYEKVVNTMAEMWYAPLSAAYTNDIDTLASTNKWADKIKNTSLQQSDLIPLFQADMGAVHNQLLSLMNGGHISYMLAGTWDALPLASEGITSIYNVGKIGGSHGLEEVDFLQASGTWSYGVNARNNGATTSRLNAIYDTIDIIYQDVPSYAYFDQDTKVPWFETPTKGVKTLASAAADEDLKSLRAIAEDDETTIEGEDDNLEFVSKMEEAFSNEYANYEGIVKYNKFGSEWEVDPDGDGDVEQSNTAAWLQTEFDTIDLTPLSQEYQDVYKTYRDNLQITSAARNGIGTVLGLGTLTWNGSGESWQVEKALLKTEDGLGDATESDTHFHLRKLEKIIYGFNGDNTGEDKTALEDNGFSFDVSSVKTATEMEKFLTDIFKQYDDFKVEKLDELWDLYNKYAKTPATDRTETWENAAIGNLNSRFNAQVYASLTTFFESVALDGIKYIGENNSKGDNSLLDIRTAIEEARAALSFGSVFDLLSNTDTDKYGNFITQSKRLDRGNPQFGSVWSIWNDQTWGHAEKSATWGTKTFAVYSKETMDNLAKLYGEKIEALDAANAPGVVVID